MLGPQRGESRNMAERVFDAARQHGAEALSSSDLSPRVSLTSEAEQMFASSIDSSGMSVVMH